MRVPVGVCEKCGRHVHNVTAINEQCSQRIDGRRCTGVVGSRLQDTDWKACPTCDGTGLIEGRRCDACEGDGVIDCRRKR